MKKYRTINADWVALGVEKWDIEDARHKMQAGVPYEDLGRDNNSVILLNPVTTQFTIRAEHKAYFLEEKLSEAFTIESHPEMFL